MRETAHKEETELPQQWIKIEPARHQVAIAGTVTDMQTGGAIGRARVEIVAGPAEFADRLALHAKQHQERWADMEERLDRTRTAGDGHYHFVDLPEGDYTLNVSLPGSATRYDAVPVEAVVRHDATGNITMVRADVALPSTALRGQVSDSAGEPVLMAEVRIRGSGERAFSDGGGRYLLAALEAGERTVVVSASGHETATRTVQLNQGDLSELDVVL